MKKQIHNGLHARRLSDTGLASIREKAFAEQWQQEQNHDLLAYLLGQDNQKAEFTERDAQVAATVVQWLGTAVGQSFLEKVQGQIATSKAKQF